MKPSSKKKGNKKKRKPSSPSPPQPDLHEIKSSTNKSQLDDFEEEEEEDDEGKTIAWLMDVFSSLSEHQITSTYVQAVRHPFKAAGILAAEVDDPGESKDAGGGKKAPAESSRRQQRGSRLLPLRLEWCRMLLGRAMLPKGKRVMFL